MTVTAAASPRIRPGARALLVPLGTAVAGAAAAAVMSRVDPMGPGPYPVCVFHAVTGLYCPGCGSGRAVYALLHGDVATALARNPFAVVAIVYLGYAFSGWTYRRYTGAPRRVAPGSLIRAVFYVIIAFWVLRNVPGWTWLSPE